MELTLLICTQNRAHSLNITLGGLVGQLPSTFEWEVIVVDNADDTETREVVLKYQNKLPISLIVEKTPGQNSARNAAIPSCKGELVVFTDDDISAQKNWLVSLYNASKQYPDVVIFGGKIIPLWKSNERPWQASAWFASFVYADQDLGNEIILYKDGCLPSSPNMAIRRTVFDAGIRFNTKIGPIGKKRISGSESEFLSRVLLHEKGLYIPEAQVLHRITDNMLQRKYLRKRCYAMGLGMSVWADSQANEKNIPKVFGVARYRIRRIVSYSLKMVFHQIQFNTEKAVEAECRVALDLGFCIGVWSKLKKTITDS